MPLFVVLTSQIDPIYPNSPVNFITSHKWRINRYCYHSMEQMQEHSTLFIVKRYHYLGIINFWNFFFTTPKLIWIVVSKKKTKKTGCPLIWPLFLISAWVRKVVTVNTRAQLSPSPIRFCLHSWDIFITSYSLY